MPNAVFSWSVRGAALAALLLLCARPAFAAPAPADVPASASPEAVGQLAAALSTEMKDVRLDASSADLESGSPTKASLVLPGDLLARIRAEAGGLGLGKAAGRVVVRVKLSGDGYVISPGLRESTKLAPGRSARFHWKVKRTGASNAPLSAHVTGVLYGDGPTKSFVLAQLTLGATPLPAPAPAPLAATAPVQATAQIAPTPPAHLSRAARRRARLLAMHEHHHPRSLKLPEFSAPDLSNLIPHKLMDMLRLGPLPPRELAMGGGLLGLAILLWAIALGAAKRKARDERRRRFRTFEPSRFWDEPGRGF